jgi:hypothetical protein
VGSLERRIRKLEAATGGGGDGCERCGDTTVVRLGGETIVSRRGQEFPHAEAAAFVAEEQPGDRCPRCGTVRRLVAKGGGPITPR